MKQIIVSLFLGVLISCGGSPDSETFKPEGLTKLTHDQILNRLEKNEVFNPNKIIFRSIEGVELSRDSISKLFSVGNTYGDQYVDTAGVVKEMILRPMTDEDKILIEKINDIVKARRAANQVKNSHSGHDHSGHDHSGHNH